MRRDRHRISPELEVRTTVTHAVAKSTTAQSADGGVACSRVDLVRGLGLYQERQELSDGTGRDQTVRGCMTSLHATGSGARGRGRGRELRASASPGTGRVVAAALVDALLVGAERAGVDTRAAVARLGLDRQRIGRGDQLLSGDIEEALWREIVRGAPHRGVAVEMARSLGRGAFRAVEYLARSSETFGGALQNFIRYHRILHGRDVFALESVRGQVRAMCYESPHWQDAEIAAYTAEFALGSVVVIGRDATASDWEPLAVSFTHEAPSDDRAHRSLFRCRLAFGQSADRIAFDSGVLDARMREADPILASLLEGCLVRALDELSQEPGIAEAVRRCIAQALPEGAPGLEEVARSIGLSGRALQRRLVEEGHTFLALLDEVRAALARRYLRRRELSLPAIALLLGYSDTTAFQRAFKCWAGVTPAEYRRSKQP